MSTANSPYRGIFSIVATPFSESYELDEASMAKQIRFLVESGVHGLVGPAFASEFAVLSDDERKRWIEIVVAESAGQLPVVATTHAVHTIPAVAFSRYAQEIGADAIMNMPPHIVHLSPEGCYSHYQALSEALDIPIFIQNMIGPVGTPLSNEMLARMCRELAWVQYIKEETLPEPRQISRTIAAAGEACLGVFGGRGGKHLIDEHRRGAAGNMPGVSVPDLHVELWNRLEAGDQTGARSLFNRLMPLFNLETLLGAAIYKEVLYRRGIFATTLSRTGAYMDEQDHLELEAVLSEIEPLYQV